MGEERKDAAFIGRRYGYAQGVEQGRRDIQQRGVGRGAHDAGAKKHQRNCVIQRVRRIMVVRLHAAPAMISQEGQQRPSVVEPVGQVRDRAIERDGCIEIWLAHPTMRVTGEIAVIQVDRGELGGAFLERSGGALRELGRGIATRYEAINSCQPQKSSGQQPSFARQLARDNERAAPMASQLRRKRT